jgi:hypothetical protein
MPRRTKKERLSEALLREVSAAQPIDELSTELRRRIVKCDRRTRAAVCARTREGCAPLFVASKRGLYKVRSIKVFSSRMPHYSRYSLPKPIAFWLLTRNLSLSLEVDSRFVAYFILFPCKVFGRIKKTQQKQHLL